MNRRCRKVLLVGGWPPPHGGISIHVRELRERLEAAGSRVRVLDLGAKESNKAPGVRAVPGPAALAAQLAWHVARGWTVHVHISGHTPKSWLIALAAALVRFPLGRAPVLTLHSGLVPAWLAVSPARRRFAAAVCRAYGQVLVVNLAIARALQSAGVPSRKMALAPAFFRLGRVAEPSKTILAARRRFRPLLSAAMSDSPIYGVRVLLAALPALARRLPQAGAMIFGAADPDGLRALARRYGVEDRVVLLGELDHESALAAIGASDLFVRPSLADGDALSVRESLALEKPVVASAVGYRPPGVTLFRPGDPMDLADRIAAAFAAVAPAADAVAAKTEADRVLADASERAEEAPTAGEGI